MALLKELLQFFFYILLIYAAISLNSKTVLGRKQNPLPLHAPFNLSFIAPPYVFSTTLRTTSYPIFNRKTSRAVSSHQSSTNQPLHVFTYPFLVLNYSLASINFPFMDFHEVLRGHINKFCLKEHFQFRYGERQEYQHNRKKLRNSDFIVSNSKPSS